LRNSTSFATPFFLALSFASSMRVDVHADAARLVPLRRGQHDDAVARAQVHQEIVGADAPHLQHLVHHDLWRGHVWPAGALLFDVHGAGAGRRERQRPDRQHDAPAALRMLLFHGFPGTPDSGARL
jgi:hypothetical protein